jgi:hypothetical protein
MEDNMNVNIIDCGSTYELHEDSVQRRAAVMMMSLQVPYRPKGLSPSAE